ncbi:hypothetical protein [uncultured Algoriphagus sp.]|uniref:hypothetical protein n=1 Tax=uncultured Algoriphagus sp. TaxID=417365 RepID=UPI002596AA61|nr:hypothetical protein [uncultured Algoriphagus sp.]
MSYLKNYELTAEGQALGSINLPPNSQGDPGMYFPVKTLTDRKAKLLLDRKDDRGKRYVKEKTPSKGK